MQTMEVYVCADCSDCEHKSRFLYRYTSKKNTNQKKVMKIIERWEDLNEEYSRNIQREKGIMLPRSAPFRRKDTLETSKKMKSSSGSTIVSQKKYIKSLCCMQLVEISISTIIFCMKKSKNTKEKDQKTAQLDEWLEKTDKGGLCPKTEYIEKRRPSCFESGL